MNEVILIVDDETLINLNTSLLLKNNGYQPESLHSGEECIALLETGFKAQLILMDIDLGRGRIDGTETARRIYQAGYDIPVVFLSGHTDRQTIAKTEDVSHYGYVHKTLGNEEFLLATVKMALKLHRTEQTLKRSEKRYHFFFDNIPIATIVSDADYRVLEWNHAAAELFGYSQREARGRILLELLHSEKNNLSTSELLSYLQSNFEDRHKSSNVNYDRTKCGRDILCEWFDLPFQTENGNYILSVAKDITEQHNLIQTLHQTLLQKEFLMREMHHRVKNNLNMISSLISLKVHDLDHEPAAEALEDVKNKISALSSLYEKLQDSEDVGVIDFELYLSQLLNSLLDSMTSYDYELDIQIGEIQLKPQQAINLGLIATELTTNAIKYAFSPNEDNRFQVTMHDEAETGRYRLCFTNSGAPFPADVDINSASSLGLELVQSIVSQLRGSLELERHPQTCFILRFPK
ncbi:MAG TPA: PAS domain S-box protein [Sediminispirochaeta sp.]|nr:PAS domain S-box protein [Sediminispirochaeta sp.]